MGHSFWQVLGISWSTANGRKGRMPTVQAVYKRLYLQFQGTQHTLLTSTMHLLTHVHICLQTHTHTQTNTILVIKKGNPRQGHQLL